MNEPISRRQFIGACIASSFIGVLSIAWDSAVNEGHPAQEGEDETEPP